MLSKSIDKERIEEYLRKKYDQSFKNVGNGNDSWMSPTKTYLYVDYQGKEFAVRVSGNRISDNYGARLFDHTIQADLQKAVPEGCKVFVSSEAEFFDGNKLFQSCGEYIDNCLILYIKLYARETADPTLIKESLTKVIGNVNALVVSYVVSDEIFDKVDSYTFHLGSVDIKSSESFSINENKSGS